MPIRLQRLSTADKNDRLACHTIEPHNDGTLANIKAWDDMTPLAGL